MNLSTVDISGAMFNAQAQQQKQLADASAVPQAERAKLKTKANEFESFYVYQVMELMQPKTDSEFDGGVGEEMFRHTLNEKMADGITKQGGFGISSMIYKELLTQQEKAVATRNAAAATNAYTPPAN